MPRRSSLVAVLLLVAACGSPPPMPAADYFPAVETELARLDQATRDLTDRYAAELEAEIETLVADSESSEEGSRDRIATEAISMAATKMQAVIESHIGQVEVFAIRVGDLVPPEVVGKRHTELVDAFRGWAESGATTITQLGTAADLHSLAVTLQQSPYADAQLRVDEACRGLLDNAAAVGVVLTCPGSELEPLQVGR